MFINVTSDKSVDWAGKHTEEKTLREFINTEELKWIQIVVSVALSGPVCLLGIAFNIINIAIFYRQGLSNTVNISMFAIAISDLCSLATLEWMNINLNPFIEQTDLSYDPYDMHYITAGWPHACFLQITIWITVYVTAERFVCISLPLKVKQIFTPLRTKVVITLIFLLMFLALSPEYFTFYYGENFYPARNQTRLGLKMRTPNLDKLVFMLFGVMGLVSFIALVVLTTLLVVSLNRKLKWRKESRTDKSAAMSRRDTGAMKMVTLVAGVLIICTAPGMFLSLTVFVEPGFNLVGPGTNLALEIWLFAFLTEAINSSINIVFFYKMSSRYKGALREMMVSGNLVCRRKSVI